MLDSIPPMTPTQQPPREEDEDDWESYGLGPLALLQPDFTSSCRHPSAVQGPVGSPWYSTVLSKKKCTRNE